MTRYAQRPGLSRGQLRLLTSDQLLELTDDPTTDVVTKSTIWSVLGERRERSLVSSGRTDRHAR